MTTKIGDDRGPIDEHLLEKTMVSGRVPKYVKKYADKHHISISDLIMAGFDSYRENDASHAFERLSYHENRVIHWKQKVIQHESESNTKQLKCNTIKELFVQQNRGDPSTKRQDLNWLEPKVSQLVCDGIPITLEELYEYCKGRNKNMSEL